MRSMKFIEADPGITMLVDLGLLDQAAEIILTSVMEGRFDPDEARDSAVQHDWTGALASALEPKLQAYGYACSH